MVKTMRANAQTQWRAVGLAVRERDAIRLEVLDGDGRGVYHIHADDVADALDLGIVPLYRLRTRGGEAVPFEAGHVRTSSNGRMIICQIDDPAAIVMVPRVALLDHFTADGGRPTRIVIPPDPMMGPARSSGTLTAVPA